MKTSIRFKNNFFEIIFEKKVNIDTKFTLESLKFIDQNIVENYNIFISSKENTNIENVIKYLKNNNFNVFNTEKIKKIIDSKKIEVEKYKEKIDLLKSIRSGKDKKKYTDFYNSLNFLSRDLKEHQKKSLYH